MDQSDQQSSDSAPSSGSALLRKTRTGHEVRQSQTMSLAKAMRLSLAKVAEEHLGLALAVLAARVETCENEHLGDLFEGAPLLMLLDGDGGRRGAAMFDADLVGALIQQQTMGKVTAPLGGDPRPMTDTDAAICAPFLDALLARAATMPDEDADRALLEGYAFGARVQDTRLLIMALERPDYRIIHLTVDVAAGARQGHITLCLPQVGVHDSSKTEIDADGVTVAKPPPAKLDQNVLGLKVELNVALTSITMPLGAVQAMAKGDVFELGITAFDQACVQTIEGRRLGAGVLGQINGTRALQLEHAKAHTHQPRRRATDRATLDLPSVGGDGTGTRKAEQGNYEQALTSGDVFEGALSAPLEGGGAAPLPDVPETRAMADLPTVDDLPDMSDLPGFDDMDIPSQTGTG